MLQRLHVRGFQSLQDVDIQLGQLTVIVGVTNSGKSALIRALAAALFSRTGGEFVREGSDSSEVRLEFDSGVLVWRKPPKGGARYEVNGDEFSRVGSGVPPEIEAFGVREIECDGVRARLNFAEQFESPFLLAGTGGQAAKLLAKVSKLDILVNAQVLARRDGERARRAAQEAEGQAVALRDRLVVQPDYEVLLASWERLCERERELSEKSGRLEEAQRLSNEVEKLSVLRERWVKARLPERVAAIFEEARELVEVTTLAKEWGKAVEERDRAQAASEVAQRRLAEAEVELHEALSGMSSCPVCGREMS